MPSGPGPIEKPLIAEIAAGVPPRGDVSVDQSRPRWTRSSRSAALPHQHFAAGRSGAAAVYPRLREALPGIKLVQVVHVGGRGIRGGGGRRGAHADALLLDSGQPLRRSRSSAAPGGSTTGRSAAGSSRRWRARCSWPAACGRTTSAAIAGPSLRGRPCTGVRRGCDYSLDPGQAHAVRRRGPTGFSSSLARSVITTISGGRGSGPAAWRGRAPLEDEQVPAALDEVAVGVAPAEPRGHERSAQIRERSWPPWVCPATASATRPAPRGTGPANWS